MADYTLTKTGAEIDAIHTKVDGIEANAEVNPTAAEIKTDYESNADTNAYTDAEKANVAGNTSKVSFPEAPEDGTQYARQDAGWTAVTGGAGGDMTKAVYDPTNVADDAFDMGNMVEDTDAKILTAAERTSIASATQPGDNISDLTNDENYVQSDPTGIIGADTITNMMSLTQAEYDAITPDASTTYFITDAS